MFIYLNADSRKVFLYLHREYSHTTKICLIMFKIRIFQGCEPVGAFVELEVSFDLFPKLVYEAVYQDHCVSVVELSDNPSYVIKSPEL